MIPYFTGVFPKIKIDSLPKNVFGICAVPVMPTYSLFFFSCKSLIINFVVSVKIVEGFKGLLQ